MVTQALRVPGLDPLLDCDHDSAILGTEEDPARNGPTDPCIVGRLPGDTAGFAKPTFGLMRDPAIAQAVRATGRSTAVLVGLETDVCVAQSAVGLLEAGLRMVIMGRTRPSTRVTWRMSLSGVRMNPGAAALTQIPSTA